MHSSAAHPGSPLSQPGGHHCSLLIFGAPARHHLSGSRSCAPWGRNSNQPQQEPGWEQGSGGDPQTTGQRVEKKSPSSLIFSSEVLILLLRFPASFPSQSCPPWLAAIDVCGGEVTQGCLSCRSSGWGKWSQEGQKNEILQKLYPGANRDPAGSHQPVLNPPAPATLPQPGEHQP